jgi:hypothetical protein
MFVMGTNTWDADIPKKPLIMQALQFAEGLKAQGIAELQEAYIADDQKLMWCTWKTENLEGLKAAFVEMNKVSGLTSELRIVDDMCSE